MTDYALEQKRRHSPVILPDPPVHQDCINVRGPAQVLHLCGADQWKGLRRLFKVLLGYVLIRPIRNDRGISHSVFEFTATYLRENFPFVGADPFPYHAKRQL